MDGRAFLQVIFFKKTLCSNLINFILYLHFMLPTYEHWAPLTEFGVRIENSNGTLVDFHISCETMHM